MSNPARPLFATFLLASSLSHAQTPEEHGVDETETPATEPEAPTGAESVVPAAEAAAPETTRMGAPSKDPPLDLCAHKPSANSTRYQHQRVVLLNAHVAASVTDAEREVNDKGAPIGTHHVLREIHAGEIARLVLLGRFPLPRHYTVITPRPAPAELLRAERVDLARAQAAGGSDDFASYSMSCADWLVVPSIGRGSATWSKVEKEKTVYENKQSRKVKYLAWELSTGFDLSLRVFKREGDAFRMVTVIDSKSAGLDGAAARFATRSSEARPLHEYLSTWPDANCDVGAAIDGREGNVARCQALEPRLSAELPIGVPSSAACTGVDDAVSGGAKAMRALATCEVIRSLESGTLLLQRNAKRFSAWTLHAELLALGGGAAVGIPLGAEDGVQRGDYYVARAPDRSDLGFARVIGVGGGGDASPSVVKFKSGEAPVGSKMYEYALLGVQFGLRPGVMYLLSSGDLETKLAYGGAFSLGYDASRFLPFTDEIWLRTNLGMFKGTADETLLDVDLGAEVVSYFGGGLAAVAGLSLNTLIASLQRRDDMSDRTLKWSGASVGAQGHAALEYAFTPDWNAALIAAGRIGFSDAELKSDEVPTMPLSAGHLAAVRAFATVGHTF